MQAAFFRPKKKLEKNVSPLNKKRYNYLPASQAEVSGVAQAGEAGNDCRDANRSGE